MRGMYIRTSGLLLERHDRAAVPVSTVRDVLDLCTQNSGRKFSARTIIFVQLGMQTIIQNLPHPKITGVISQYAAM